jgi:hypothetical protein
MEPRTDFLDVTQFLKMDDIVENLDENNYFNTLLICYLVNIDDLDNLNKSCRLLLVIIYLKMYDRYGFQSVNSIILTQQNTAYVIVNFGKLISSLLDDFIDLLEYYVSSDAIFDELQNPEGGGRGRIMIYNTMLYRTKQITDDISKDAYIIAITYIGKNYYQMQLQPAMEKNINFPFFDDYYEKQIIKMLKNIYADPANNRIIANAFQLMHRRNAEENAAIAQRMDDLAQGRYEAVQQDDEAVQQDDEAMTDVAVDVAAANEEAIDEEAAQAYYMEISQEVTAIFQFNNSMEAKAIKAHEEEITDRAKNVAQAQAMHAVNTARNIAGQKVSVILENTKMIAMRQAISIKILEILPNIPQDRMDQIYIEIMQRIETMQGIQPQDELGPITLFVQEQIGIAEDQVKEDQALNIEMYIQYNYIYAYVTTMAGIRWASMITVKPPISPHLGKRQLDSVSYVDSKKAKVDLIRGGKNTQKKTHRKKYTNCKSKKNNKTRRHKKRRTHKIRRS